MAKLDLGGGLIYRVERRDGTTWIALTGNISELANFDPLKAMPGPLVLDLSGLTRINSLGMRNWVYFVRDYEALGQALTFERVPPVVVNQMSMISNFMGAHSLVRSLVLPYLCPSCSKEDLQVLELTNGKAAQVNESAPCPKCRAAMEFDDVHDMYTELFVK
jgi:hypothetical protein